MACRVKEHGQKRALRICPNRRRSADAVILRRTKLCESEGKGEATMASNAEFDREVLRRRAERLLDFTQRLLIRFHETLRATETFSQKKHMLA
jgi:hypothetical protein